MPESDSWHSIEDSLAAAEAFEREVIELGHSERFLTFLADRSKEPGGTTLEDIEYRLAQADV